MGKTIIQKIFENHSKQTAIVGDIIDIDIFILSHTIIQLP